MLPVCSSHSSPALCLSCSCHLPALQAPEQPPRMGAPSPKGADVALTSAAKAMLRAPGPDPDGLHNPGIEEWEGGGLYHPPQLRQPLRKQQNSPNSSLPSLLQPAAPRSLPHHHLDASLLRSHRTQRQGRSFQAAGAVFGELKAQGCRRRCSPALSAERGWHQPCLQLGAMPAMSNVCCKPCLQL